MAPATLRRGLLLGGVAAAGLALVLAQVFVGSFGHSALAQALHNAMHFPWGMLIALMVWTLLGPFSSSPGQRAGRTVLITIALTTATEVLQIFTPRDASFRDLAWNIAGTLLMIGLIWSFRVRRHPALQASTLFLTLALAMVCFAPAGQHAAARLYLKGILPDLLDLKSTLGRAPVTFDERITLKALPDGTPAVAVRLKDVRWSGITLQEVFPDWNGYSELVIDAHLDSSGPVAMNMRLGFSGWLGPIHSYRLQPGPNQLRLPFAADSKAATVPAVRSIILYAAERSSAGSTLYISRLHLVAATSHSNRTATRLALPTAEERTANLSFRHLKLKIDELWRIHGEAGKQEQ